MFGYGLGLAGGRGWTRFAIGLTGALALSLPLAAPAFGDRAFSPRFSENVPGGDIAIAANTLMSCPAAAANCLAARAGTASGAALSNNAYEMEHVDVDAEPTTFASSRASLSLPPGASVLFAGLYYGGRTTAGANGAAAPDPAARSAVRLLVPGTGGYQPLNGVADDSTSVTGGYQGFVDVTAQVAQAGPGTYTVADVQSGTGVDRYAGWALVVAYTDTAQPPRNLTVYDGLQSVQQGDPPLTIPVSGFETPPTGPVRTRMGFVAYEGDRGGSGDRAVLNGRELTDAANPATNFFNSAIATDGVAVSSKEPDYLNQLGFDAILTGADGYLANGDTAATIELFTTLEQYLPGVVTFATELNPAFLTDLTVVNEKADEGPAKVGEELEYTIEVVNDGPLPVSEIGLVDRKDARVRFLKLRSSAVECEGDERRSRRLECSVPTLAPGERARLRVSLRPLRTGRLANTATVSVAGAEIATATESTRVRKGRARLQLTKAASRRTVMAGKRVRFEIAARVRGELAAVDVAVCDRLPDGLSIVRAPGARIRGDRACWEIAELAPGKRRRFVLSARAESVPRADEITNVALAKGLNLPATRARERVDILPASGSDIAPPECRVAPDTPARC